ncbi:MAG: hypothetical protein EPO67_15815 [Reyranella sp.]|nr:MAG: hypothetical protein EPO67_15815 [Reyranella sp.]
MTAIGVGLLLAAAPAFGADRHEPRAAARDTCKPAQQASCMVIRVQGSEAMADHGADAGDAYDLQGNPVDRHDNVVAAPGGRDKPREVFATPVGVRF